LFFFSFAVSFCKTLTPRMRKTQPNNAKYVGDGKELMCVVDG
jgi:hypothetical protein